MFSQSYKRYVLFILTTLYMLHYADRHLVSVMLQPIKEDLHLSDTQLGFLTGIAFALFYATLGIPIARLADRGNRVSIASVAIALWGVMVMACGLVANFIQLVLARIGASVGEAGCMPPSYSLIGDYFSGPAHTRAMSIYMLGGVLAAMLGFSAGGWLNELYGWRTAFLLAGIPGVAIAVLVKFTVVEPRLRLQSRTVGMSETLPSLGKVFATLWGQTSFRYLVIAVTLSYMIGWGLPVWIAAFLTRSYGMASSEIGLWLGFIIGISGAAGILSGGYWFERYLQHKEEVQARVIAAMHFLSIPLVAIFTLAAQKNISLVALAALVFIFNLSLGPIFALMQRLVVPNMRATALSLVMLVANLVGLGLGPQVIGILSDMWMPKYGAQSLGLAMLASSLILLPAAYCFWALGRTVKGDLTAVKFGPAWPSGEPA